MKRLLQCLCAILVLSALFVACAPSTAQNSISSTPTPTQAPRSQGVPSAIPSASPGDEAWNSLVAAAKKEGKVTFYSYSVKGDGAIGLSAAFQKKYGISVDIITGRGSELTERIKTEHRNKQVAGDMFETMATYLMPVKDAGLTVSLKDLPVLKDQGVWVIDPATIDPEENVLPVHTITMSPYVNSKLVTAGNEPKSFKDVMTQPQWKGKIALSDPNLSTGAYNTFMSMVDRNIMSIDAVAKLVSQDPTFYPGTFDAVSAVARGEQWISLYNAEADVSSMLSSGAPLKAIPMDEGTLYLPSCIEVLSDSPHPNAAKLFVNWILSQEGQTEYSKVVGLLSVRKDVQDFRVEGTKVVSKQIILYTKKDADRDASQFKDKVLGKLWKR